jgi:UDP-N-acetylmuramoyl-L-alanyl-D-glutamate--2,6-diaminopimelate ligase
MKILNDILKGVGLLRVEGPTDIKVHDIAFDSREVQGGSLFIAVPGTQADGHDFIDTAIEKGAKAIVCSRAPEKMQSGITYAIVNDSAQAMGIIASGFYNHPSEKLDLVGITGTNGKTTIATLLYRLSMALGYKTGLLSTVAVYIGDKKLDATHTTPDSVRINKLMAQMVDEGVQYCFMEVSSHAVDQKRISGLHFTGGAFTNISHDHLDYHKTFDAYLKAKKRFFDDLPEDGFALSNIDDKNGAIMLQNTKALRKYCSLRKLADFKGRIIETHFDGTLLSLDGVEFWSRLIGEFNAYNMLMIYAVAILLGWDKIEVLQHISSLQTVDGRFEPIQSPEGKTAIVDYAHTPDALLNVLKAIRQIRQTDQKIITVVGAGGNRDKSKRPLMAKYAADSSDTVILTSDNPRFEEPEAIIKDMQQGVNDKSNVLAITNRKEAIRAACMMGGSKDIILVAGKGHETYQEIKGVKHHFDDKEVVRECFNIK